MTRGSMAYRGDEKSWRGSAATDGNDDFQLVAGLQGGGGVGALGHDFAVALHGNALASVAQGFDQGGNGVGGGKLAGFPVDAEF